MHQSEGLGRKLSRPTQLSFPSVLAYSLAAPAACGTSRRIIEGVNKGALGLSHTDPSGQDLALAIIRFASGGVMTPAQTADASTTKSVKRACRPGANNCKISTMPEKITSDTSKCSGFRR